MGEYVCKQEYSHSEIGQPFFSRPIRKLLFQDHGFKIMVMVIGIRPMAPVLNTGPLKGI